MKLQTEKQLIEEIGDLRRRNAELEKAEAEREQAKELFDALSLSSPIGIYIVQDGKFVFGNPQFKILTGYSEEELENMNPLTLVIPEDRDEVRKNAIMMLKGERSAAYEYRVTGKDKKLRWIMGTVTSINYRGRRATLVNFMDISKRKRAEDRVNEYAEQLESMVEARTQELRDAQEQLVRQEKLAMLGQLAGGIGHELRNPLGAIKNAAYFLNMVLEELDPDIKETLAILQTEVDTSERIISNLLNIARSRPPVMNKTDINRMAIEALACVSIPEEIEVITQLDETIPLKMAEDVQIRQVFENIILNAVQAMPDGGQLMLKSYVLNNKYIVVSTSDTGVGIAEENKDKIFEPLFTLKAKGLGLGLAIIKTMVETHGGIIEFESEPGKGTTFQVKLPIDNDE
jgi:PAS domain S-box-containing protein